MPSLFEWTQSDINELGETLIAAREAWEEAFRLRDAMTQQGGVTGSICATNWREQQRRHPKAKWTQFNLRQAVLKRNFKKQCIMGHQVAGQSLLSIMQIGPVNSSSWSHGELDEDELVLNPLAM